MSGGDLTGEVIGAAIEVHRCLGPGLLESLYQRSLGEDFILDFYFPDQLVVELKAVTELAPVHTAQLMTYMKLSDVRLGLLINFNVPVLKQGIKRVSL